MLTSSENCEGQGQHVLVLAPNPFENDARIRKQIDSLLANGYVVTVIATREKGAAERSTPSDAMHVFRVDERVERDATDLPEALENDTFGRLGPLMRERHRNIRHMHGCYDDIRRAVKFQRALNALSLLAGRRREKRERLKTGLRLVRDGIESNLRPELRLFRPVYFFAAAWRVVETDRHFAARIADVGPPVIVHGHDLFTAPAAVEFARKYGARAVYDAHEYEPERNPPMSAPEKALVTELEDRVISRADGVITVGRSIRDLYLERQPGLNIHLVFNCPDIRAADTIGDNGLRARAGVGPDVPLIAYVGLVSVGSRGLQVTLDALKLVPDAVLAVIGPRRAQADAELRAAAAEAGLSERIKLLDPVLPNEVVATISDATASVCLIQPTTLSYRFAMPNKLFESALANVPIIGSDLPDIGGFLTEFGAGLIVDHTDPAAIAAALRQVIDNPDAHRMSDEVQAALRASYSWEAQERTLLSLYASLGNDAPGAGAAAFA